MLHNFEGLMLAMPSIGIIALGMGVLLWFLVVLNKMPPTDTQVMAILAATLTLSGVIILSAQYIITA